nr:MAG TPA: hypothetical protein [Caudoviricetes sp.]
MKSIFTVTNSKHFFKKFFIRFIFITISSFSFL